MTGPNVLILHGYQHHRPRGHWLWWLAEHLRERHVPVHYPQLPAPDAPMLADWMEAASAGLDALGGGRRIVVAHSLGTVLWMRLAAAGACADAVLLVAPPSRDQLGGPLAAFRTDDLDVPGALAAASGAAGVTVVGRERDPYRTVPLHEHVTGWRVDAHELPGEGHINLDDGHGPFPPALAWVLTGSWPSPAPPAPPGPAGPAGPTPDAASEP